MTSEPMPERTAQDLRGKVATRIGAGSRAHQRCWQSARAKMLRETDFVYPCSRSREEKIYSSR